MSSNGLRLLRSRFTVDLQIRYGLYIIGLSFDNYTPKYVEASCYQVARDLVLPFTAVTSFVVLRARLPPRCLLFCALITADSFAGMGSGIATTMQWVVLNSSPSVVGCSALVLPWCT